jgi:WbqC-like protein family
MKISIHQPEHLPWIGFFHKMFLVDVFVLLDVVQYRKQYFQNRNRIRTHNGFVWNTVPVLTKGKRDQLINEVKIDWRDREWPHRIWGAIEHNYSRAPFYLSYKEIIKEIYIDYQWENLVDLNITLIKHLKHLLGIKAKLLIASNLGVSGKSTNLIIDICKKIKADVYLSGRYGIDYLEEHKFMEENIELKYHKFEHPIYQQVYDGFIPEMSVIDLLFCHGEKSLQIIKKGQDHL